MDILMQLTLNSIIAGSVYALAALGFNLIYSTTKFFDVGYGALTAVGGYTTYYLLQTLGLGTLVSVLGGVLAAGLLGYIVYYLVYVPLRRRKASQMVLLVASLGVFMALQGVIAILFTSQFQVLSANVGAQRTFEIFGGIITEIQLVIAASAIVLTALLLFVLKKTLFGKMVQAIGDNEEVSQVVGINTTRIIGFVFFIGSCIAGLAGILVGFDLGIEPTMGLALLLKAVIAAIVGGVGSLAGGFIGAMLLGFVENFGIWYIPGEWKDAIAFGVLILFLLVRPRGIFQK